MNQGRKEYLCWKDTVGRVQQIIMRVTGTSPKEALKWAKKVVVR